MSLIDQLSDNQVWIELSEIANILDAHSQIQSWKLNASQGSSLVVGIKDNEIGGGYRSPALRNKTNLSITLYFKDNTKTTLVFPGELPKITKAKIKDWKTQGFKEDIIPDFPGHPNQFTEVFSYSNDVDGLLKDPTVLIQWLLKIKEKTGKTVSLLNSQAAAFISESFVWNSSGFCKGYRSSGSSIGIYANGVFGAGEESRSVLQKKNIEKSIAEVDFWLPLMEQKPTQSFPKQTDFKVLLFPDVFESLFFHFFISQLNGESIDTGHSRYHLKDFQRSTQVLSKNISLSINSQRKDHLGSIPFSKNGTLCGRQKVLDNGKLCHPLLNLKYAKKFNLPITPPYIDGLSFEFDHSQDFRSWEKTIEEEKNIIVVSNILGLHTQDAVRGDFSLAAPNTVVKYNGEFIGQFKILLNGNFFTMLNKDFNIIQPSSNNDFYALLTSIPFYVE